MIAAITAAFRIIVPVRVPVIVALIAFLGIKGRFRKLAIQGPISQFTNLVVDWIMQRMRAQVPPVAVESCRTGCRPRSHHFEHLAGDVESHLVGSHLRGGYIQRALATLAFGDCVSAFPGSLKRFSSNICEGLSCLKIDEKTGRTSRGCKDPRWRSLFLRNCPGTGLRERVVARFIQSAFGDA